MGGESVQNDLDERKIPNKSSEFLSHSDLLLDELKTHALSVLQYSLWSFNSDSTEQPSHPAQNQKTKKKK